MIRLLSTLAFLAVASFACAQPVPEVRGDVGESLDAYLTDSVSPAFSGVILAVKDGEIVLRKGYGHADREAGTPNTPETVFQIGSVTKPITAVAVLSLVDQGLVDPSDSIAEYLGGVPEDRRDITVHHLLTHTAGFPGGIGEDYAAIGREEYVRLAMEVDLDREPGAAYEYSNVGFALLAAIIERVTGGSYDAYVQRLFREAGMEQTGYRLEGATVARGYRGDDDLGLPYERPWAEDGPFWNLRGNGGLLSTADDLYRLHLALEAGEILSRESVEAMHAPHTDEGPGSGSHYGYGWALFTTPRGTSLAAHNGGDPGFTADVLRFRDEDAVLIVLSNDRAVDATRLSRPLEQILFGGTPEPFRRAERQPLDLGDLADTVRGRRALAFVETVNAASEDASRAFTREHLDEVFRRNEDRLVGFFEAVRGEMDGAPFTPERVEWDGEESTMIVFTTLPDGRGYRAELGFQPGGDQLIEGMVTDYVEGTSAGGELPDTPAGRTVSRLLEAPDGDDALRGLVETVLSAALRESYSEAEHLSLLRMLRDDLASGDLIGVDARGPHELALRIRQADGGTLSLQFTVEPEPPHGLTGVEAEAD